MLTLTGMALHAGVLVSVHLERSAELTSLTQGAVTARLADLSVARTDHGVSVSYLDLRIDLIEHLFAAIAIFGAFRGLRVTVEGPELPLLGGGAVEWTQALEELGPFDPLPASRIVRPQQLRVDDSEYRFEPAEDTRLAVEVDFGARWERHASFSGCADDWPEIAQARTFGYASQAEALRRAGRAAHVDPKAVLVLDDAGGLLGQSRSEPNELARHKLLDLIGDLLLYGGLPQGHLLATRPGHGRNHRAFAEAMRLGVIETIRGASGAAARMA